MPCGTPDTTSIRLDCLPSTTTLCFLFFKRKQFALCFGVIAILLLNVMAVLVWVEVLCWIDRVWSSK